jgi:hypothetical protein
MFEACPTQPVGGGGARENHVRPSESTAMEFTVRAIDGGQWWSLVERSEWSLTLGFSVRSLRCVSSSPAFELVSG